MKYAHLLVFCAIGTLILVFPGCRKDPETVTTACDDFICGDTRPTLKEVKDLTAVLAWDVVGNSAPYALHVIDDSTHGGDTYLICALRGQESNWTVRLHGQDLESGARVVISGTVKSNCDDPIYNSRGDELWYIRLSDIKSKYCTSEYALDPTRSDTLQRNWEFIGFMVSADSIHFPPCEAAPMSLEFSLEPFDGTSRLVFSGQAAVNTFGGSYVLSGNQGIAVHDIAGTRVGGHSAAMDYEKKYLDGIHDIYRFDIHHNLLTLTDSANTVTLLFQALDE